MSTILLFLYYSVYNRIIHCQCKKKIFGLAIISLPINKFQVNDKNIYIGPDGSFKLKVILV